MQADNNDTKKLPISKNLIGIGGGALLGSDTHKFDSIQTADTFSSVGNDFEKKGLLGTTLIASNLGGNSADVRVLGSLDGGQTFKVIAGSQQTIATGSSYVWVIQSYYTHLKLEAKSATASTPTSVEGQAAAIAGPVAGSPSAL